jgi:uncharacterized protein YqjF (DUF2071 family)
MWNPADAFAQRAALGELDHRPWPLPDGPWLMGQTWLDLLFAHWPVDADALRPVMPPQLPLDTFDGRAWLGISPFLVRGLHARWTPPLPFMSTFPEINVRTYVEVGGKPGIYFLSLDADSPPAVRTARRTYRLPYFHSEITVTRGSEIEFASNRVSSDGPPASFEARYAPSGDQLPISPGSLDRWLTERYCLYTLDDEGSIHRGDIHHPPWPLQPARAEIRKAEMTRGLGIELSGDPLLHFSARQDVVLWPIQSVE